MKFITGLFLIDAPASALNNSGDRIPRARTDNTVDVKHIRTKEGDYPYISAQAYRAWLRNTITEFVSDKSSPIYRDDKVVYTDGNPIKYWDDDLFGYMRAPGESTKKARAKDPIYQQLTSLEVIKKGSTEKEQTITRVSPFRVSTIVSTAPVYLTADFGTMARQEQGTALNPDANPAPYEHRFYRAVMQGLFSLDLRAVGKFYYRNKTGFRNLDEVRKLEAEQVELTPLPDEKAYQFSLEERKKRVTTLLQGMMELQGGAKQAVHYTDVAPSAVIVAVVKGGNHIFKHVIGHDARWQTEIDVDALQESLQVHADQLCSDVYIGWNKGFLDGERSKLEQFVKQFNAQSNNESETSRIIHLMHPRQVFQTLINAFGEKGGEWLDA